MGRVMVQEKRPGDGSGYSNWGRRTVNLVGGKSGLEHQPGTKDEKYLHTNVGSNYLKTVIAHFPDCPKTDDAKRKACRNI